MVVRAATTVHGGDISADALFKDSGDSAIMGHNWEAVVGADDSDLVPLDNPSAIAQLQLLVDNKSTKWIPVQRR